jgi:hypothetical protein
MKDRDFGEPDFSSVHPRGAYWKRRLAKGPNDFSDSPEPADSTSDSLSASTAMIWLTLESAIIRRFSLIVDNEDNHE